MNSVEAMEWAADFAERSGIFAPVTNARGYADGWKPPTPAEKAKVLQDLAAQVTDPAAQAEAKVQFGKRVLALFEEHKGYQWDEGYLAVHPNFLKELKEQFGE